MDLAITVSLGNATAIQDFSKHPDDQSTVNAVGTSNSTLQSATLATVQANVTQNDQGVDIKSKIKRNRSVKIRIQKGAGGSAPLLHIATQTFYETLINALPEKLEKGIFKIVAKYADESELSPSVDGISSAKIIRNGLKYSAWTRVEELISGISKDRSNMLNAELVDLFMSEDE